MSVTWDVPFDEVGTKADRHIYIALSGDQVTIGEEEYLLNHTTTCIPWMGPIGLDGMLALLQAVEQCVKMMMEETA